MSRTVRILTVALTALTIAAPAAIAMPIDPIRPASAQNMSSPDAQDAARHTTPADLAALAEERYYSSYGQPEPITPPATAPATADGIAALPFILGLAGTLIVGLAAGGGLHELYVRHRHAAGLAT